MYQLMVRLNLSHRTDFKNQEETDNLTSTKSTYIPVSLLSGSPSLVAKHGDIITFHGSQAAYIKKIIDQGVAPHFEIFDIPDVTDLHLEADEQNVTITWVPSEVYLTEVQYRNGDGEWVDLPLVEQEVGEL